MGNETTITALLTAAIITGVIHTAAGPDHLPFIAISKSRGYGHFKTILWTVVCGIGHVGSSMLIALGFMLFADLLNRTRLEWLEEWRSDIAAYAMIGMGAALLLHSLYGRWRHRPHAHRHVHADGSVEVKLAKPVKGIGYYILFRNMAGKASFRAPFLYNK